MAETIELSDFTSAQRRIESIKTLSKHPSIESASLRDSFLAPLTIDERNDPIGPCASRSGKRCSDKGFLSLSTLDYLELLDETARITRADKAGATAMDLPPIFNGNREVVRGDRTTSQKRNELIFCPGAS